MQTDVDFKRSDSNPACGCKLVSYLVPKYTYHCKVGDVFRVYVVEATSVPSADAQVCTRYNDETDTDFTIYDPNTVVVGCLPIGTPVLMANGTTKDIEALGPGDMLLAGKIGSDALEPRALTGAGFKEAETLLALDLEDGDTLRCSGDQMIMTTAGPVKACWLQPGAELLEAAASSERVTPVTTVRAVTPLEGQSPVVSVYLGEDWYFIAGKRPFAWKCKGPYDDRGTPL